MKVRLFPLSVVVVALAAGLEAWISITLRINPFCGANTPQGGGVHFLGLPLLILALPGWIGLIVLDPLTAPLRHAVPIAWADRLSLGYFYLSQMFVYFLAAHAVRRFVLSLRRTIATNGGNNADVETPGEESQRDVSS